MQDYIFHNDRLLLKKDPDGRYHVPYENELPDRLPEKLSAHEVLLPNGSLSGRQTSNRNWQKTTRG